MNNELPYGNVNYKELDSLDYMEFCLNEFLKYMKEGWEFKVERFKTKEEVSREGICIHRIKFEDGCTAKTWYSHVFIEKKI